MARISYVDKNGLRKGPWSKDEDDKLRTYIQRYGHWNWREIPKFAGVSRCGKSCRLRWMNYLRPNIKHGNFSKEEEDLIMEIHNKIGNKWARIAAELPGRSDNEIKNYWHTHLKKRVKNDQNDPKNMYHETKNQMNFINNLVDSSKLADHDALQGLWTPLSSSNLSFAITHEYPCVTKSTPSSSSSSSCASSVALTSSDSLIATGDSVQTCSDEYDDGNFWTDPIFADLDAISSDIMAPDDYDESVWSTMDFYLDYHSQFMI